MHGRKERWLAVVLLLLLVVFVSSPVYAAVIFDVNEEAVAYADMHGQSDSGMVIDLVTVGEYVNITGFNSTNSENINLSGGGLIPEVSGVYKIASSSSWSSVGGGGEYGIQVMLDGQPANQGGGNECQAHRIMASGGEIGVTSVVCIIHINASQNITIAIRDEDSPVRNVSIISGSWTIVLIKTTERRSDKTTTTGLAILAAIFCYIAVNFDKIYTESKKVSKNRLFGLKIFFFTAALLMAVITTQIATATNIKATPSVDVAVYTIIVSLSLVVVFIIWDALTALSITPNAWKERKEKRRKEGKIK